MRISDWSSDVCSSDLDRIELVQTLALEERKGRDIVEGESQIGQDERSALRLGEGSENLRNARVGLVVAALEVEPLGQRFQRIDGLFHRLLEDRQIDFAVGVHRRSIASDEVVEIGRASWRERVGQ